MSKKLACLMNARSACTNCSPCGSGSSGGGSGGGGATGDTGPAGGVISIVAGTNITISPANGQGVVTINSRGGGGGGGGGATGATGATGAVAPYIFDGGNASSTYYVGPAFDAGNAV